MKKIFYLFTLLALSSCSPVTFIGMLDYRPLTNKGLFVTESNSVGFDYEPIGSLNISRTSGWVDGRFSPSSVEQMYSDILDEAKKLDANGIINMSFTSGKSVVTLTGMFIKRKEYPAVDVVHEEDIPVIGLGENEVDDLTYSIFREYESSVCLRTQKKLSLSDMKKIKTALPVQKKLIQFFVSGQNSDKPYAGFSENLFIDYEKGTTIEINE